MSAKNAYLSLKKIGVEINEFKEHYEKGILDPHFVEIHLPPRNLDHHCWLQCKYCYTHTTFDLDSVLSKRRVLDLIKEITSGNPRTGNKPKQFIFSGFKTDPLNSEYFVDVLSASKNQGITLGVHSKCLVLDDAMINALVRNAREKDYISCSIDAGNAKTYANLHGQSPTSKSYYNVLDNISRLVTARDAQKSPLKIRATYLLTDENVDSQILDFVQNMLDIGVDSIRFSQPMKPTMGAQERAYDFPELSEKSLDLFKKLYKEVQSEVVFYQEFDELDTFKESCYSRWLFPVIGFDGYFYPCCLTSSQEFPEHRIGNLATSSFWELYQKKPDVNFAQYSCQCDRKIRGINRAIHDAFKK